ncbi:DUF2268 domain-containing putative Zn-dependent protease [Jannaschia sp. CCS1]|uniref:DUF2268 domain-containing putative Zn-dependent protease n=1 Tax=Jannaschia sp. (strain CCS1) TaxID=290400 RepID=UPI00006BFFC2|nr:DUF2268 domain-containing putative Zn-dependent protease [Jannaschia sp. CCS1]ABD54056.1 hypothetical protein Jann_1139 [Jannaschia sp. CCS1]
MDRTLPIISRALEQAERVCREVHGPVALDLTVRATERAMPPALAISGSAFGPGRIDLGVDDRQALSEDALFGAVLRAVYHEFHHVLRWDGPGYGVRLGDALVSEGLAQVFVHEVMTCPREPWEQALDEATATALLREARAAFKSPDYDHAEWFFGTGQIPEWAGYTLGKTIVTRYLEQTPGTTALACAHVPAEAFAPYLE